MGKHYSIEFKQKIIDEYKSGKSGGYARVARKYELSEDTVYHWVVKDRKQGNQENLPYKRVGRTKEENNKQRSQKSQKSVITLFLIAVNLL